MRVFLIWLILTSGLFGSGSLIAHWYLSSNPTRVLVAVDASYPMTIVWPKVELALNQIKDLRYREYSLITGKSSVHGWQDRLQFNNVVPYGPRIIEKIINNSQNNLINAADQKYLVTNAPKNSFESKDWQIIYVE